MRIGELAEQAGVSVRALRYYEEQGLLTSSRSAGGQRHYPEAALDRVHLVQQLYAAGLTSRTIAELLPCVDAGISTPATIERLAVERDRIDEQITRLAATRDRLDAVIDAAARPDHPCAYSTRPIAGGSPDVARRVATARA